MFWLGAFYFAYRSTSASPPSQREIEEILGSGGNENENGEEETPQEKHKQPAGHHPKPHPQYQPRQVGKSNLRSIVGINSRTEKEMIDMRDLNKNLPFDNPSGGVWTQGWDIEPVDVSRSHPLTVYVVPHSHCDPGWLKTFDDYFQSQTKQILTSVVEALKLDKRRKFIWAEVSYFEWWWKEQTAETQDVVRELLKNKQLEFVTGGWVQPDEANTQLYAMEIQLQEGHDFINRTFGEDYIPQHGWSIDPFGYSPTMAYLLKKHKFKGMLIQRVHYAVKKELALHKHLEFMWRQTWDTTGEYDIFTHMLANVGVSEDGIQYAVECPWEYQVKPIHDGNVEKRAMILLDQYMKKAALYRSNVVIAPLGDDFRYRSITEANAQYDNYQRIFDYLNENVPGVTLQFGTLSDYFNSVVGTFNPPILKGSFFTYSDRNEDYWSGYFTSRVFDKALDRWLERALYAASSMGATKEEMQQSRRALSLFQHHDGVTGTATDEVVRDYAKRIFGAIRKAQKWMIKRMRQEHRHLPSLQPCLQSTTPRGLSVNVCHDGDEVVLYNPLETEQFCGNVRVRGRSIALGKLPCEEVGPPPNSRVTLQFDEETGLMTHPIREQWMVWSVEEGGAYLFFPGKLDSYKGSDVTIEKDGYVVHTKNWRRTVIERTYPSSFGTTAKVIDFVYETFLDTDNEEWFVRFSSDIENKGIFHTDLNGYNFDTHYFRADLPIQSQVFPMPTHASIEDGKRRLTILSEHAQGTASLKEGSIDIWLDRRLAQDDGRGVGQGVQDNVPTRTRLRIVIEEEGYDTGEDEFEITPLCKQMWEELNHPLELFGSRDKGKQPRASLTLDNDEYRAMGSDKSSNQHRIVAASDAAASSISYKYGIPVVFLVYKRVDYFRKSIDTLRQSDFPRDSVPIIISHDGHVEEMISFVESIKSEFRVIQLFHPFACSEHPNTFPGDDPKLNVGYRGDSYGNPREARVCCLKHHFAWMLNEVFNLDELSKFDGFLFMEEDYIVAPTIYETIQTGFSSIDENNQKEEFFGLTFDITDGFSYKSPPQEGDWSVKRFVTGPMAFRRDMYDRIKKNAAEFCLFDEYNWDWSIVHMMGKELMPYKTLVPNELQVAHIGLKGGLHERSIGNMEARRIEDTNELQPFHGKIENGFGNLGAFMDTRKVHDAGYGGWGHPSDHDHCLKLFEDKSHIGNDDS
eukprot:scaffold1034_cov127-Cylindrotheca_fusiformis.AAC.26